MRGARVLVEVARRLVGEEEATGGRRRPARWRRAAARRPRAASGSGRAGRRARRGPAAPCPPRRRCGAPSPRSSSGTATFSSAVSVGISRKLWNTNPTCRARSAARCVLRERPEVGTGDDDRAAVGPVEPAHSPRSVVLPLPEGPTMAHVAPASTSNETPSSTVSDRLPLANVLVRSRAERTGIVGDRRRGGTDEGRGVAGGKESSIPPLFLSSFLKPGR